MPRSPQILSKVLAADAKLAAWQARYAREEALTRQVRRHLPRQLGDRVRAGLTEHGELELVTAAGAIAAVLRQRGPDLIAALQREGVQCSGIKLRVQAGKTSPPPAKQHKNQIDKASTAPLEALSATLPAGPLKRALARLIRRIA